MGKHLLTSVQDGVATMTMNRPEARNALSLEMRRDMRTFLAEIEHDPKVRCVVLAGAGDHFMAGGDVKSLSEIVKTTTGEERRRQFEQRIHDLHPLVFLMRRLPKPIIASVQGAAAGAGLSFAMACDLIIAADTAFFTLAYINIGTSPDGSGTYFLPRLVGLKKAMEIALLGDRFDAATAKAIGLVNFVVPAASLAGETAKLAARLASGPTRAIGNTKRLLNHSLERGLEEQLAAEAVSFADCAAGADWAEGVTAFAEKRKPRFTGN